MFKIILKKSDKPKIPKLEIHGVPEEVIRIEYFDYQAFVYFIVNTEVNTYYHYEFNQETGWKFNRSIRKTEYELMKSLMGNLLTN